MRSQICRFARTLLFTTSKQTSRSFSGGRTTAAAATVSYRGRVSSSASSDAFESEDKSWVVLGIPLAVFMLQEQEACTAKISEIISRFERKSYKLVAIKILVPKKEFTQKHYHDLKLRPFFNGLCEFLSSRPVVAMVWEGKGVIKYGRKLIGATDPVKSEPGTVRGDLAVVVGRNLIHGSYGPMSAKDEITLWFKPEELISYRSNAEK